LGDYVKFNTKTAVHASLPAAPINYGNCGETEKNLSQKSIFRDESANLSLKETDDPSTDRKIERRQRLAAARSC